MRDRIDRLEDGTVDDVAIDGVDLFRMEMLDDDKLWICLYRDGLDEVTFHVGVRNGKLEVTQTL